MKPIEKFLYDELYLMGRFLSNNTAITNKTNASIQNSTSQNATSNSTSASGTTNSTGVNTTKKNVSVDQYGNEYSYGSIRNVLKQSNSTATMQERDIAGMDNIIIITTVLSLCTIIGFGLFFILRFYKRRMLEIEETRQQNLPEIEQKKYLSTFAQNNHNIIQTSQFTTQESQRPIHNKNHQNRRGSNQYQKTHHQEGHIEGDQYEHHKSTHHGAQHHESSKSHHHHEHSKRGSSHSGSDAEGKHHRRHSVHKHHKSKHHKHHKHHKKENESSSSSNSDNKHHHHHSHSNASNYNKQIKVEASSQVPNMNLGKLNDDFEEEIFNDAQWSSRKSNNGPATSKSQMHSKSRRQSKFLHEESLGSNLPTKRGKKKKKRKEKQDWDEKQESDDDEDDKSSLSQGSLNSKKQQDNSIATQKFETHLIPENRPRKASISTFSPNNQKKNKIPPPTYEAPPPEPGIDIKDYLDVKTKNKYSSQMLQVQPRPISPLSALESIAQTSSVASAQLPLNRETTPGSGATPNLETNYLPVKKIQSRRSSSASITPYIHKPPGSIDVSKYLKESARPVYHN